MDHADDPNNAALCLLYYLPVHCKIMSLVCSYFQNECQNSKTELSNGNMLMWGTQEVSDNFTKHVSSIRAHSAVLPNFIIIYLSIIRT